MAPCERVSEWARPWWVNVRRARCAGGSVHLVELAYHLAAALCLSYLIYLFYHPHAPRVTVPLEADEKADVLPPERDRKRRTSDGKSIPCHDPSTGHQIGLVRSSHSFTR